MTVRLTRWLQRHREVRAGLAVAAATGGVAVALLTLAVGHCSAFGGRCPADPQPLWENDVFGGVGIGVAVSVLAIVVAVRPDRRGLIVGAAVATGVGLAAGLWAVGVTGTFGWSG